MHDTAPVCLFICLPSTSIACIHHVFRVVATILVLNYGVLMVSQVVTPAPDLSTVPHVIYREIGNVPAVDRHPPRHQRSHQLTIPPPQHHRLIIQNRRQPNPLPPQSAKTTRRKSSKKEKRCVGVDGSP